MTYNTNQNRPGRTRRAERAARRAIARAKGRAAEAVTPDDLLAGALLEVSYLGVAWVGEWALDVQALEDGVAPDIAREPDDAEAPAAAYSEEAVALFERAASLARRDGATGLGLVHLLAAAGERENGLMAELRRRHGFTEPEWRAALARGQLGPGPGPAADGRLGTDNSDALTGGPELLSVDEAADRLGVHAQTVRNYIKSGKLLAYRLAGERYIRVLRRDLLDLLERVRPDDSTTVEESH